MTGAEFWYNFVTLYLATIFSWAEFHRKEAQYEHCDAIAEMTFIDWIPLINTVLLLVFYLMFRYDIFVMKHKMVHRAKKILKEEEEQEGYY